jgi:hypothetical protein
MFKDFYGLFAIIVVTGVFIFNLFVKKKDGKDWIYAVYFIITLFTGMVLYSFALFYNSDKDTVFSPGFLILKSLSISLKSFSGDFNVSTVSKLANENLFFHIAVIIHFFASVSLTFLVVVKFFGQNMINKIRVFLISLGKKYIVIGCDGQAGIFLKNLTPQQKRQTTVIIQSSQIDRQRELINKGYAVVTVKEIKTEKKDAYTVYHDAIKKAGAMRCNYETKIISMSEQDEINLLAAKILTDFIINKINLIKADGHIILTGEQEKILSKIKLDARIMYSFLERAEHFLYIENAAGKVRFFNPYEIRARKFLWENPITKLIPFHWIDTEKAKLKNNINGEKKAYKISNIFVGFGSTNKAIFKKSIINNQLLNIDYNALIICKDAKKHEKMFMNSAIGLFDITENGKIIKRGAEIKPNPDGSVYLDNPPEQNRIVFEEADALSVELYDSIIKEIGGAPAGNGKPAILPSDYATVIIALGDNRFSVETALELRQKLYESDLLTGMIDGKKYPRVRIYVKINEETILADKKILNSAAKEITCKIETFGADEEILTKKYIIDEEMDTLAKNIANRYEGKIETVTAASEWNTCTQFHRESSRSSAMSIRVKLNLLGLDLEQGGEPDINCISAFHARYEINTAFDLRTERKKMENIIKHARREEEKGGVIPDDILTLKIKDEIIDLAERNNNDFADTPRNNLGILEHQRWNTFHLANDWTKLPREKIRAGRTGRQDGPGKQHACITTFHGLIKLREIQKNIEKAEIKEKNEKQYIEAESLLNADTIRHDFNTMDFLLDLTGENFSKMRKAEEDPNKEYIGVLTGSGYNICKLTSLDII